MPGILWIRETMKYLTPILLVALLCTALLPVSVAADTAAGNGSGYISVINPPVADFYTSVQYGPSPFTVSFADTSRGSLPMTYLWEFGDGAGSAMQNPTHTYHYNGEYTVSLTVTNQYRSDTKTVADFIGAGFPPETNFSASPADGTIPLMVTFTDLSKNTPTDWKWDFGDGTTSSDQNPVHTYTLAGIYDVRLKVSSHFGSDALDPDTLHQCKSFRPRFRCPRRLPGQGPCYRNRRPDPGCKGHHRQEPPHCSIYPPAVHGPRCGADEFWRDICPVPPRQYQHYRPVRCKICRA